MGSTAKLLLPTAPAALLLLAAACARAAAIELSPFVYGLAALLGILGGWLIAVYLLQRPLRQLAVRARAASGTAGRFGDVMAALGQAIDALEQTLATAREQVEHERSLRRHSEHQVRELEERHALALRCVNDGLWEWDLKSNAVYYAPTWKSALGFGDHEIGDSLQEWHGRIHPDDRAEVLRRFDEHMQGVTPMFECDQRLLHRDGNYRWFMTRGRAVRSASGKAYKVIGLNTDISARKRAEQILTGIADGLSAAAGTDFFKLIVKNFAEVLGVKYAFITECIGHPPARVRMLAAWQDGAYSENLEYDLAGTPCDITVREGRVNLIADELAQLYPVEAGFRSYLGIPICNTEGRVLGHLACLDAAPMREDLPVLPIFTLFALRAGLEMEHQHLLRSMDRQAAAVAPVTEL